MDIKITDLPAKVTPLNPGDLFEVAEDQGSGNFISKKVRYGKGLKDPYFNLFVRKLKNGIKEI